MRDERGRAKALQAPFFLVGHKRNWNVSPDFFGGGFSPTEINTILKISKYISDPAPGGVLERGGSGGGLSPPARLLCPSTRQVL